eukprot:gene34104-biopygen12493
MLAGYSCAAVIQAALPEADRGAPVAYRLALPPHWQVHDVFAQHRHKPFVQGAEAFVSRRRMPIPDPVMVDGQAEAHVEKIVAYMGVTLAQLSEHLCDTPELGPPEACYLPWEHLEQMEDGSMAVVTELMDRQEWRPVRILVLFSGTGSVEKGFTQCFPKATVVTLDQDPRWQSTHISTIEDWDPTQYPPGFFDVILYGLARHAPSTARREPQDNFKHDCAVVGCLKGGKPCEEHGKTLVVGQKNVELMELLVERYTTDIDMVVLDPFMGSETTGIGALRMGRDFIGVELRRANFMSSVHYLSHATVYCCAQRHVGDLGLDEPYPKMKVTNVK